MPQQPPITQNNFGGNKYSWNYIFSIIAPENYMETFWANSFRNIFVPGGYVGGETTINVNNLGGLSQEQVGVRSVAEKGPFLWCFPLELFCEINPGILCCGVDNE